MKSLVLTILVLAIISCTGQENDYDEISLNTITDKAITPLNRNYSTSNDDVKLGFEIINDEWYVNVVNESSEGIYIIPSNHIAKSIKYRYTPINPLFIGNIITNTSWRDTTDCYSSTVYYEHLGYLSYIPKFAYIHPNGKVCISTNSKVSVSDTLKYTLAYLKDLELSNYYRKMISFLGRESIIYQIDTVELDITLNALNQVRGGYIYPGTKEQYDYLKYHYEVLDFDSYFSNNRKIEMPVPNQDIALIIDEELRKKYLTLEVSMSELSNNYMQNILGIIILLSVFGIFITIPLKYWHSFYLLKNLYPKVFNKYPSFSSTINSATFFFDLIRNISFTEVLNYYLPFYIDLKKYKLVESKHRLKLLRMRVLQFILFCINIFILLVLNQFYW